MCFCSIGFWDFWAKVAKTARIQQKNKSMFCFVGFQFIFCLGGVFNIGYSRGRPVSRNQPKQSSKQEGILGIHIRSRS